MTLYAIYTPAKQELATEAAILDLGLRAECAKRVDLIRQGYRRRPDVIITSFVPNYVFAWLTAEDWHAVAKIKTVRDLMGLGPKEELGGVDPQGNVRPGVVAFLNRINADYHQRMAQIEAGERVSEYEPGDVLRIMTGPLAGQLARFTRMVETAHDFFPRIEADMQSMGRTLKVRLDPLVARKIA